MLGRIYQVVMPLPYCLFQTTLQFKLSIQRTTPESWHIPYHDDDYTGTDLYERSDLIKWLCLRR